MAVCIPQEFVDIVEKIIDESSSSLERIQKLREAFGGNLKMAQEINLLYEKKLLLKDQETAINNFVDSINGIELAKKEKIKQQIAERLANRNETIQKEELLSIVKDIYDRKYDLDIKPEDVKRINKVKGEIESLRREAESTPRDSAERLAWGRKQVELSHIIDEVVNPGDKINFRKLDSTSLKAIQASLDISFALRQGNKVLANNPRVWAQQMVEALKPFKAVGNKRMQQVVFDEFKARLVSDPLYDLATKSKLAIGVIEEFFPTSVAEKFPALGRVFKASNDAFTIFSQGSRMALFRNFYEDLVNRGITVTPELAKEIAEQANTISGRGNLGPLEPVAGLANKGVFSARFIKSSIDVFKRPFRLDLSPEARKIAIKSSAKSLGLAGANMLIASLFTNVGTNPTASNFGKAQVGDSDVWFDVTGGLGSYIVLAARIKEKKTTSATTGRVTRLNTGEYNAKTIFEVFTDFASNKLAPVPSALVQYAKGRDYAGNKPTLTSAALNAVKPISPGTWYQLFTNQDASTAIIGSVFDALGAGVTDYSQFKR